MSNLRVRFRSRQFGGFKVHAADFVVASRIEMVDDRLRPVGERRTDLERDRIDHLIEKYRDGDILARDRLCTLLQPLIKEVAVPIAGHYGAKLDSETTREAEHLLPPEQFWTAMRPARVMNAALPPESKLLAAEIDAAGNAPTVLRWRSPACDYLAYLRLPRRQVPGDETAPRTLRIYTRDEVAAVGLAGQAVRLCGETRTLDAGRGYPSHLYDRRIARQA